MLERKGRCQEFKDGHKININKKVEQRVRCVYTVVEAVYIMKSTEPFFHV